MSVFLRRLRCPECFAPLATELIGKFTTCDKCNTSFPVIANSIPILIRGAVDYLEGWSGYYKTAIADHYKLIDRLGRDNSLSDLRSDIYFKLINAFRLNLSIFEDLEHGVNELLLQQTYMDFKKKYIVQDTNYPASFEYLKRDWGWLDEGENEISIITNAIKSSLFKNEKGNSFGNGLVLGAGLGRLGVELSVLTENMILMDSSFTMANWWRKVIESDFSFYEIRLRNVLRKSQLVNKRKASTIPIKDIELGKIQYLISDAYNIPFQNHSFQAIFSIYFTDVLPLKYLVKELKRLLSTDGIFIHFGPFNYHFKEITNMLSVEEVKQYFKLQGFELLTEDNIIAEHLSAEDGIKLNVFINQLLVFRLK